MYVTTPTTPAAYAAGGGVVPASAFAPYVGMNGLSGLDLMVVGGLGETNEPSVAAKGISTAIDAIVPLALIAGAIWLGVRTL